jgi:glycosyltransferase involved in cell wall biosynthesis
MEIIIVDDASTDNTIIICENFSKINKNIRIFKIKKNRGPGYCRNLGIKKSKGKYIVFLDSDDMFYYNSLKNIKTEINKFKPDIIYHNFLRNKKPHNNNYIFKYFPKENLKKENFLDICIKHKIFFNECWKYSVSKKFLLDNKIEFRNIRIAEDQLFGAECLNSAKKITINHNPILFHQSHYSGLSKISGQIPVLSYLFLIFSLQKIIIKSRSKNIIKYIKLLILYSRYRLFSYLYLVKENNFNLLIKNFKKMYEANDNKINIKIIKKYFKEIIDYFEKKLKKFIKKDTNIQYHIFSKDILGKAVHKFFLKNNISIRKMFDDDPKLKLDKLENYKFNKNKVHLFVICILDKIISTSIRSRIQRLKIKRFNVENI